ncbi:MAG: site-specific integrase [Planctomycetota bacterium]
MTPRRNRKLPSYRLHRASGRGVVTLEGRDHYLPGEHGSERSQAEYDRLIAEYLANGRHVRSKGEEATVADLVTVFTKEHVETYYRKNGEKTSEVACMKAAHDRLTRLYGQSLANEFGPLSLTALRNAMIEEGLSYKVINGYVFRIRHLFKWGVANELVRPEVYQALMALSGLKRGRSKAKVHPPKQPVLREHVEAVLPLVAKPVAAMIELQWLTGMRSGEVTRMRTGDIDRSGSTWEYRLEHHKTEHHGRSRTIPLGPKAQEILRPFLKADPEAYLFSPRDAERERNRRRRAERKSKITPSQRRRRPKRNPKKRAGELYPTASYRRAIVRACEEAGTPCWSPHQLRHSAATRIRKEFGIEAARVILGHSSPLMTEVYAEIDRQKAWDIMLKMG